MLFESDHCKRLRQDFENLSNVSVLHVHIQQLRLFVPIFIQVTFKFNLKNISEQHP